MSPDWGRFGVDFICLGVVTNFDDWGKMGS